MKKILNISIFIMISYLTNLMKIIRSAHGVYVSFVFLKWIILTTYTSLVWILSYIPNLITINR